MPKQRRRTFIREWRKYREISQEDLAHAANMSAGNLSVLENGKINYTQETLERLADALDCEPGDLLTVDPNAGDGEIYSLARNATPAERKELAAIAKVILKAGTN